jgi:aryl-alcohol dehydrogenase-like predicted oxidoreductase
MLTLAYEAGINFFDNSEAYAHGRSEKLMGEALKRLGFERDTWCVSSKAFFGRVRDARPTQLGLARKHLVEACHAALRRLQVDYLDLYFCHRPDPETPIEEVVRTMNILIRQGKVLYWGTSEWSAGEIGVAWCLHNPDVSTVILGASKPEQLKENLGALEVYNRLDDSAVTRLEELTQTAAD